MEVALSLPIFVAFLAFLIDGSFFLFARETIGSSVADGVRVAAIARDEPTADRQTVQAMFDRYTSMPGVTLTRVVVYEARELGAPAPASCRAGNPSNVPGERCNVYVGDDLAADSELSTCTSTAPWCTDTRAADDLIGVHIEVRYDSLTGLAPIGGTFTDHAVTIIEADAEQRGR